MSASRRDAKTDQCQKRTLWWNQVLYACGKTGTTRRKPEDSGESPKIGEVHGSRNNASSTGAPRGDGYTSSVGLSGDQRGHALPLRLRGICAGVQTRQPLAVSQEFAGSLDGCPERGGAEGPGRAGKEEAGSQRALEPNQISIPAGSAPVRPSARFTCGHYARTRVMWVISGGQLSRKGRPTVPRPRLT